MSSIRDVRDSTECSGMYSTEKGMVRKGTREMDARHGSCQKEVQIEGMKET